jgi:hypothetical protein
MDPLMDGLMGAHTFFQKWDGSAKSSKDVHRLKSTERNQVTVNLVDNKVQFGVIYQASVSSSKRERIEGLTERDESMTPEGIDD